MSTTDATPYVSVRTICREQQTSERYVRKLLADGKLLTVRVGHRVLVPRADYEKHAEQRAVRKALQAF